MNIKNINLLYFSDYEIPRKTVRFAGNHPGLYELCKEQGIPVTAVGSSCITKRNWFQTPIAYLEKVQKLHEEYVARQNEIFLSNCSKVEGFDNLYTKDESMYHYRGDYPNPAGIAPNYLYPVYQPNWGINNKATYGYIDIRSLHMPQNGYITIQLPKDWYLGWAIGKGGALVCDFERHLGKGLKVRFVR